MSLPAIQKTSRSALGPDNRMAGKDIARRSLACSRQGSVVFRDILVAVDGSADAELALTHAIDLAAYGHSRLTLFTAVAQPSLFAYWGLAAPRMLSFFERAEAEAETIAQNARGRVPGDVCVTPVLTRQRVKSALVRQITDGHHDLVVMGSRGRGRSRSAVLGSVSNYVLQHSTVPVLILHSVSSRQHEPARSAATANASVVQNVREHIDTLSASEASSDGRSTPAGE
jgi:nucleotide-binding universal stress UspA family protein